MALVNQMCATQLCALSFPGTERGQGTLVLQLLHRDRRVKANLRICKHLLVDINEITF